MNKHTYLILTASSILLLALAGCNQVSDQAKIIKDEADKNINNIQTGYESTKNQVLETKAQIDEKVEQAKTAADAVGKLVQ